MSHQFPDWSDEQHMCNQLLLEAAQLAGIYHKRRALSRAIDSDALLTYKGSKVRMPVMTLVGGYSGNGPPSILTGPLIRITCKGTYMKKKKK